MGNDLFRQKGHYIEDEDANNEELDAVAVSKCKISITPMNNDRTNQDVYKRLSEAHR